MTNPNPSSTLALLRDRQFQPLFTTQFLGAINDNLFKNALVVLALYRLAHLGPVLVALAGGVFLLPYAIFSAMAGQLADAREKSRLIRFVKIWELALMLLAGLGFFTGNFAVLMAVLFGLGIQATFFSPLKYGILPDLLEGDALVVGNGLVEAGTFVGILLGTVAGGLLVVLPHGEIAASLAVLVVALAGIWSAWAIPPTKAAQPGLRLGVESVFQRAFRSSVWRRRRRPYGLRCWASAGSGRWVQSCWRNSRPWRVTCCVAAARW